MSKVTVHESAVTSSRCAVVSSGGFYLGAVDNTGSASDKVKDIIIDHAIHNGEPGDGEYFVRYTYNGPQNSRMQKKYYDKAVQILKDVCKVNGDGIFEPKAARMLPVFLPRLGTTLKYQLVKTGENESIVSSGRIVDLDAYIETHSPQFPSPPGYVSNQIIRPSFQSTQADENSKIKELQNKIDGLTQERQNLEMKANQERYRVEKLNEQLDEERYYSKNFNEQLHQLIVEKSILKQASVDIEKRAVETREELEQKIVNLSKNDLGGQVREVLQVMQGLLTEFKNKEGLLQQCNKDLSEMIDSNKMGDRTKDFTVLNEKLDALKNQSNDSTNDIEGIFKKVLREIFEKNNLSLTNLADVENRLTEMFQTRQVNLEDAKKVLEKAGVNITNEVTGRILESLTDVTVVINDAKELEKLSNAFIKNIQERQIDFNLAGMLKNPESRKDKKNVKNLIISLLADPKNKRFRGFVREIFEDLNKSTPSESDNNSSNNDENIPKRSKRRTGVTPNDVPELTVGTFTAALKKSANAKENVTQVIRCKNFPAHLSYISCTSDLTDTIMEFVFKHQSAIFDDDRKYQETPDESDMNQFDEYYHEHGNLSGQDELAAFEIQVPKSNIGFQTAVGLFLCSGKFGFAQAKNFIESKFADTENKTTMSIYAAAKLNSSTNVREIKTFFCYGIANDKS